MQTMKQSSQARQQAAWLGMAAALFGLLAVVAGAFGAHFLKAILSDRHMQVFTTAVEYQMYHALALLIVVILIGRQCVGRDITWLLWSGRLFVFGIVLFCGSLYLLVASGNNAFGALTPLGGVAFIFAWGCLLMGIKCTLSHSDKET